MLYITGDTHGVRDFEKLNIHAKNNPGLSKSDYVIIAGDFGGVWSYQSNEEVLAKYQALPFSILFVDGNNENFDVLEKYPISRFCGGKVRKIKPDIFHLMRGEVFEIQNKKIFTFGGAHSQAGQEEKVGVSWWAREIPEKEEFQNAQENLQKHQYKVDYIITHTIDKAVLEQKKIDWEIKRIFQTNRQLSVFEETVEYKHWYFGHYHKDESVTKKKTCLYNQIIKI